MADTVAASTTELEDRFYAVVEAMVHRFDASAQVDDDLDLLGLGFDSLAMTDLILELEEALDCSLPPEVVARHVLTSVVRDLKAVFAAVLEGR